MSVSLRSLNLIDPAQWASWWADPEVVRFLEARFKTPKTEEDMIQWIKKMDAESTFSIFFEDEFVGAAWTAWATHTTHGIRSMHVMPLNKVHWGKGIATEVSLELIKRFPCRKWLRSTYGTNKRMQRVFVKSGFSMVAEIPDFFEFEGGLTSKQVWMRDGI